MYRLLSTVNWTALSPFSISYLRKSHSQAGLATVNQHVSFQFGSTGGWVAAQVAAVELLSTMLNHVHFDIFCHLEGEITLRTWVLLNQSGSTVEEWLKKAEAVSKVEFWKVKVNAQTLLILQQASKLIISTWSSSSLTLSPSFIFVLIPLWFLLETVKAFRQGR